MGLLAKFLTKILHLNHPAYEDYLFNNPHAAIAIVDTNFNFIKVNPLYAKQFGYEPQDCLGKNHFDLYPSVEVDGIFRNVIASGQSYHTYARSFRNRLHPEQPVTYWDWSMIPAKNKQGKIDFLILQFFNVTERVKALRELEERFTKAFDFNPMLMTIRDLKTGCFLNVNAAWTKNTGYSREEAIGKTPQDINLYVDRDPRNLMSQSKKSMTNIDLKYKTKSGHLKEGLFSSEIIEIGGNPCMLNALVDITQRKTMEQELGRLDRLSLIGQMAAGIGHEIRNPMTTIRGFLQILSMKEKYAEDHSYFKLMISEVDRANSIITEFLSLSKTRSENLSIGNLNSIIAAISPLLQAQALQLDKQVKYLLGEIPENFVCEKEIRQLILNMVTNALEASPPGGLVSIQTKQEKDRILLVIQDQGSGIDPQLMNRLGTPFLTTKPQGTGLGLAICYSIMERHAGDIQVETGSTGTTFTIRFPICSYERVIGA